MILGGRFPTQVIGFYLPGLRPNYSIRPRINSGVFSYMYPALRVLGVSDDGAGQWGKI